MLHYEGLLREANLKVTPQRLAIVENLDTKGHMSIDELFESIKSKFPSVSLATVYKNINSMFDVKFVQEVKIPNLKSRYELTKEAHSHVVCTQCGKIDDVTLDMTSLLEQVSQKSHFDITDNAVIFSGVCQDCKD